MYHDRNVSRDPVVATYTLSLCKTTTNQFLVHAGQMVASLFLWLLHLVHASLVFLTTKFLKRRYLPPQSLTAYRSKLPKHLAIILVSHDAANPKHTEELFMECLVRVVKWCKALGIEQLTAYDAEGKLSVAMLLLLLILNDPQVHY